MCIYMKESKIRSLRRLATNFLTKGKASLPSSSLSGLAIETFWFVMKVFGQFDFRSIPYGAIPRAPSSFFPAPVSPFLCNKTTH